MCLLKKYFFLSGTCWAIDGFSVDRPIITTQIHKRLHEKTLIYQAVFGYSKIT
jgi:hypothetical protein